MSVGAVPTEVEEGGESTRSLLGTYAYMSPEQKAGGEVDARSDLYAIGLMTARLLTGKQELGYDLPSDHVPDLDPGWDDLVRKAVSASLERRYQTAVEMRGAVAGIVANLSGAPAVDRTSAEESSPDSAAPEDKPPTEAPAETEATPKAPEKTKGGGLVPVAVAVAVVLIIAGVVFALVTGKAASPGRRRPAPSAGVTETSPPSTQVPKPEPSTPKPVRVAAPRRSVSRSVEKPKPAPRPSVGAPKGWTVARKRVKVMTPGGEEWKEITYYKNPLGMEFVKVPAGEFQMGSPDGESKRGSDEGPVHRVRIAHPFFLQAHEVTQRQWEQVMGSNPSHFKGANRPVEQVSWNDAQAFIKKLCAKERVANGTYRLPTEAEWEYACRACSRTPFYTGETISTDLANYDGDDTYGNGRKGKDRQQTTDVGSFPPNAFGVYDMHGNVWEWCSDWYDSGYYSKSPPADPRGPSSGTRRVWRGGSRVYNSGDCRSANRGWGTPEDRYGYLGFRVSVSPPRP